MGLYHDLLTGQMLKVLINPKALQKRNRVRNIHAFVAMDASLAEIIRNYSADDTNVNA
jgi:hypothetical protein